uniref:Uncharacterized protein n=1 Tax=Anguilla anguilla TaxID=7936 RepID=A0A0E9V6M0_ANGAN
MRMTKSLIVTVMEISLAVLWINQHNYWVLLRSFVECLILIGHFWNLETTPLCLCICHIFDS